MLIGREAELAAAGEALRGGRSVLIIGDRGTGRSALLAEAARRHGTTVLAAPALPGDDRLPGAGLQRLLTPVRAEIAALDRPDTAALARVLGLDGPPDAEVREPPLAAAIGRLARGRDWLWCLDDADRLDELSRTVLLSQPHIPVLATMTGAAAGTTDMTVVRLGRLGPADALRLLATIPGLADHPAARLVLAQAAGNPLALTELAAALPAPADGRPTATELPVPARLHRALAPAVDRLDAVRLRAALLAAFATETPGREVRTALDTLVAPEIWERLATDGLLRPGRWRRFRHPVIRAAVIGRAGLALSRESRQQLAALLLPFGPHRAWHTARAYPAADDGLAASLDRAGDELTRAGRGRAAAYAYAMAASRSDSPAAARDRSVRAAQSAYLAGDTAWSRLLAGGRPGLPTLPRLIRVALLRGDEPSRRAVREAVATIDRTGTGGAPGAGLSDLIRAWALAVADDGDPDGLIERVLHEDVRGSETVGPDQRAIALATIAMARHETVIAGEHFTRAVALAPSGSPNRLLALVGLAWTAIDGGDLDAAVRHAREVLGTPAADPRITGDARAGAAAARAVAAVLRETADAGDRVRDARDALQEGRHTAHEIRLDRAQGVAAAIRGHGELAFRRLRRLYHPDGTPVHHRSSDLGLADLAQVAVALGRADEVVPVVEAAGHRVRTLRAARVSALWHRAKALLAGPDPSAETFYRLALADPAGDQWPFERALARMDYAQWLRRRHRPAESRPLLAAARDTFADRGLVAWQERAEGELAAAAPPRRPGDGPAMALTPQQRQVVTLAAQGLTNAEIAGRLGLSPRTVAIHLSRAYPVLGVTRRTQLPSALEAEQAD